MMNELRLILIVKYPNKKKTEITFQLFIIHSQEHSLIYFGSSQKAE